MRDPGGLPIDDTQLEPEAARRDGDRLARVWHAQLGAPEDIDDVERPGPLDRGGEGRIRWDASNRQLVRVDRDAIESLSDEVAEDAVRRPTLVRRGADDSDPSRSPQQFGDLDVIEDRYRSASLLEIEVRGGAFSISPPACLIGFPSRLVVVLRQVVASRSYGWPSAAGGLLRPTRPARMTIVTR
jgi:hypothetical protein